jgi:hypothetical protein
MGDFRTFFIKECPVVFKVRNIADGNKRIKLFNTPIKNGCERDLLAIPSVSEDVIRHSLLKGDLFRKLKAKEIIVTESNIELLQFDECHKQFLIDSGIVIGVDPDTIGGGGSGSIPYAFKQGISLIGNQNGSNISFYTPDRFINGIDGDNEFKITVVRNGRTLTENEDYILLESGGSGTGWDTVRFICNPPYPEDVIEVSYTVAV